MLPEGEEWFQLEFENVLDALLVIIEAYKANIITLEELIHMLIDALSQL